MPEWFLGKHLRLELSPEERALLTVTNEFLINEALLQPQVFVHRDFHSRNLMVLPPSDDKGGPGVIDFQDALRGPIGYDLVSLLKDCYISWSRERVERWVRGYRRVLGNLGANVGDSEYQFMRWFDLIGVQRHVKVLGIFARALAPRRQDRLSRRPAAGARLRARRLPPLSRAGGVRTLARVARGPAAGRGECAREGASRPRSRKPKPKSRSAKAEGEAANPGSGRKRSPRRRKWRACCEKPRAGAQDAQEARREDAA